MVLSLINCVRGDDTADGTVRSLATCAETSDARRPADERDGERIPESASTGPRIARARWTWRVSRCWERTMFPRPAGESTKHCSSDSATMTMHRLDQVGGHVGQRIRQRRRDACRSVRFGWCETALLGRARRPVGRTTSLPYVNKRERYRPRTVVAHETETQFALASLWRARRSWFDSLGRAQPSGSWPALREATVIAEDGAHSVTIAATNGSMSRPGPRAFATANYLPTIAFSDKLRLLLK